MTGGSERAGVEKDPSGEKAARVSLSSPAADQRNRQLATMADPRLVPSRDARGDPAFGRAQLWSGPARPIPSLHEGVATAENKTVTQSDNAASIAGIQDETKSLIINESVKKAQEAFGFTTRDIAGPLAYVQNVFGVTLPEDKIPALVILDQHNKERMHQLVQEKRLLASSFKIDDPLAAWQDPQHNILFLGEDAYAKEDIVIHEAGHPVIDFLNPQLLEVYNSRQKAIESIKTDQEPPEVDIEASAISMLIHEGVMKWIQINSLESPEEIRKEQNRLLTGEKHEGKVTIDEKHIDYGFACVSDGIAFVEKGIQEKNLTKARHGNMQQSEGKYIAGHYLVYSVMEQLSEDGASEDERRKILVGLIQNPPKTLDACRDPNTYLQKLRATLKAHVSGTLDEPKMKAEATPLFAAESSEVTPRDTEAQLREAIAFVATGEPPNPYLTDAQRFAQEIIEQANRWPKDSRERNHHLQTVMNTLATHAIIIGTSELAQRMFDLLPPADRWLLYATAYTADKPDHMMLANWRTALETHEEKDALIQDPFFRAALFLALSEIELHNYR